MSSNPNSNSRSPNRRTIGYQQQIANENIDVLTQAEKAAQKAAEIRIKEGKTVEVEVTYSDGRKHCKTYVTEAEAAQLAGKPKHIIINVSQVNSGVTKHFV